MYHFFSKQCWRLLALVSLAITLAACGHSRNKPDNVNAVNAPSSFDLTILADKDGQFDVNSAPLTEEDLKSHLNYLKDESKPVHTILLKRGEKQKIKDQHIVGLARVAVELSIQAFVEDDGEIQEIRASTKKSD